MTESIGRQYETAIPALSDTANIQEAFRIYHYGVPTTVFNPTNTDPAQLEPKSIAYYLTDFQNQIDNITAALSPTAYEKRGNLLVAGDDGPLVLELNPLYPAEFSPNGLVLTSYDGADQGMRWEAPSITSTNIANLANKALVNSTVSGGGAVVGTTAIQTLTNKTISLEAADNTITGRLASTNGGTPAGVISQFAGSAAPNGYLLCQGQQVAISSFPGLYAVLGTTYGALTNGSGGAGTTHFRIPNFQGRVPIGVGTAPSGNGVTAKALAGVGGDETVVLTTAQMPSHTHTQDSHNHTQDAHGHGTATTSSNGSHNHSVTAVTSNFDSFRGPTTNPNINHPTNPIATGTSFAGAHTHTVTVGNTTATNQATTATNQNTGGGGAHNNLQPYIVVNYIIKT